jgi:hypothetical protein
LIHPWISPFLQPHFRGTGVIAFGSPEALYAADFKYQIALAARASRRRFFVRTTRANRWQDAGATKSAAALDKRPQSKESGRSGSNRGFRNPIEDK